MAWGLPAYYKITLENKSKHSISSVFEILNSSSFTIKNETDDIINITSNLSMMSWGEDIEIRFHDNSITINSKCSGFFPQIYDYGKNKKNVDEIINLINRIN